MNIMLFILLHIAYSIALHTHWLAGWLGGWLTGRFVLAAAAAAVFYTKSRAGVVLHFIFSMYI